MTDIWLYYIPCLLQHGGKVAFSAHIYEASGALNSPERVWQMIDALTKEVLEGDPEPGTIPVVPLGWTLITAKRAAIPKDNGKSTS